ncbi:uncharacterized protein LOC141665554 [Apium graveolens]|uniref:uncharacterized protein LOC141665554 n=1 Tax=Apium graveolens TaxID=4045 RepID=UPI003D7AF86B
MTHRYVYEAVDRSFRDIRRTVNPNADSLPFGGFTMLMGGDFRQTLPIVPKEGPEGIVAASISKSYLWRECKIYTLTENMCVEQNVPPVSIDGNLLHFKDWISNISNGLQQTFQFGDDADSTWIKILKEVSFSGDPIKAIVDEIYTDLNEKQGSLDYFRDRAILTPLNEYVDKINQEVLKRLSGASQVYKSCDTICKGSSTNSFDEVLYPTEYLNSLKFSGVPNHEMEIKVGAPISCYATLIQRKAYAMGHVLLLLDATRFS